MSFDPDYLEFMASMIELKPETGVNGWGGSTYGTGRLRIPAYLTFSTKKVSGNTEETINSTVQAIIPPPGYRCEENEVVVPVVTTSSEVVIPDGTTRRVLSVDVVNDEDGAHHQYLALT